MIFWINFFIQIHSKSLFEFTVCNFQHTLKELRNIYYSYCIIIKIYDITARKFRSDSRQECIHIVFADICFADSPIVVLIIFDALFMIRILIVKHISFGLFYKSFSIGWNLAERHAVRYTVTLFFNIVLYTFNIFFDLFFTISESKRNKFITADTIRFIRTEFALQCLRNGFKHIVTRLMTETVINIMQSVCVNINTRYISVFILIQIFNRLFKTISV